RLLIPHSRRDSKLYFSDDHTTRQRTNTTARATVSAKARAERAIHTLIAYRFKESIERKFTRRLRPRNGHARGHSLPRSVPEPRLRLVDLDDEHEGGSFKQAPDTLAATKWLVIILDKCISTIIVRTA